MQPYKPGMQPSEVQKKFNLDRIVKLASNENPYGYSHSVQNELKTMATDFEMYPDGYASALRNKIASTLNVSEEQLVFGAGSDEIITFICRAFLSEGTNTVMAAPTFPQYRQHALIEGAALKEVPTVQGYHDLKGMLEAIDDQTKIVWLCTPDNPTGTVIQEKDFHMFMEQCPKDVIVVLDEAYQEFMDTKDQYNLKQNLSKYENLIVLRTFSKIYGLAGFRAGYGISSEQIATKLNIVRGPFNMSIPTQRVALVAFDDEQFVKETREKNAKVRFEFESFLQKIGWTYYPSVTNFLLVNTPIDAEEAAAFLLEHGFIVRSGNLLGYPHTLRITIGLKEDMQQLQQVILKLKDSIQDGVVG